MDRNVCSQLWLFLMTDQSSTWWQRIWHLHLFIARWLIIFVAMIWIKSQRPGMLQWSFTCLTKLLYVVDCMFWGCGLKPATAQIEIEQDATANILQCVIQSLSHCDSSNATTAAPVDDNPTCTWATLSCQFSMLCAHVKSDFRRQTNDHDLWHHK